MIGVNFTRNQIIFLYYSIYCIIKERFGECHRSGSFLEASIPEYGDYEKVLGCGFFSDCSFPCLRNQLYKNEKVKYFLENEYDGAKKRESRINPKFLYDRLQETKKTDFREINFDQPYSRIYLLFIGCNDVGELDERMTATTYNYTGYYYSHFSHGNRGIKSFTLELFYLKVFSNAKLKGFHEFIEGFDRENVELAGDIEVIGRCCNILLYNKHHRLFLNLIIHSGELITIGDLFANKCLFGIVSGISSFQYPIATEFLLINTKNEPAKADISNVAKYLNIRKNQFFVDASNKYPLEDTSDLEVLGIPVSDVDFMAGNKSYRIVSINREGIVSQSHFQIFDNYSGEITQLVRIKSNREPVMRTLKCSISFNNLKKGRVLIFETYRDAFLHSFTAMKIPHFSNADDRKGVASNVNSNEDDENSNDVIVGAFISINDNDMFGNSFFMIRDKKENIQIGSFYICEIDKKNDNKLKKLKEAILKKFPEFKC